jgi:hypothetical protein
MNREEEHEHGKVEREKVGDVIHETKGHEHHEHHKEHHAEEEHKHHHEHHEEKHEFHIQIDRHHYTVKHHEMTGEQLRHLPHPPIGPERDLFEVVPGGTDRKIANDERVEIRDGKRFFTAPAQINPGRI